MQALEVIAYIVIAARAVMAIAVVALPVAGAFFLFRRRFVLGGICLGLFAVFVAASVLDWRRGDKASEAFGTPQILSPIDRSLPVVLVDNYAGCSPTCRLVLVKHQERVLYGAVARRSRRADDPPPEIRFAFRLATPAQCANHASTDRIERLGGNAGCIIGSRVRRPPTRYLRVTVDNFPIARIYDLGFPRTTHTFHQGSFFLLVESVSGGQDKVVAWAARVVRAPRTIIPRITMITGPGDLQVVGNRETLKPTLEHLFGWSLGASG